MGEFLSGPPRIAPLWDDLSPNAGGLVFYKPGAASSTLSFSDVPEFASSATNSFSVTLYDNGDVGVAYGSVAALDGLAGVTEGGGAADPGVTDLSASWPLTAVGTTNELYTPADPFDLSGQVLVFHNP